MSNLTGNGWTEYQRLVLSELERHSTTLDSLAKQLNKIEVEIGMLKIKSGVWGLMGGLIPVVIAILIQKLSK